MLHLGHKKYETFQLYETSSNSFSVQAWELTWNFPPLPFNLWPLYEVALHLAIHLALVVGRCQPLTPYIHTFTAHERICICIVQMRETWCLEQELTDSRVGQAWGILRAYGGWTNRSGLCGLLLHYILCCECMAFWLLTLSLKCPPLSTLLYTNELAHICICAGYICSHNPHNWYILLLAPGPVLTRHVQEHTYQSVSSKTPKGLFKCNTLLPFCQGLFSQGIQNKYALDTIWNLLSSQLLDMHFKQRTTGIF